MKNLIYIIILFLCISLKNYGQKTYTYQQPEERSDGWKTNSVVSQQLDTTLLYKLFSQMKNGKNQIHSVLVVKDEQLIIEEYFNGYTTDKPHDLRSVTKSIRSVLLGIAIGQGFIENVNDPISKYLKTQIPKKNLSQHKEKITIKHLLTMSSGLDCNDWDKNSRGQEDKVHKKKDWIQYTLDLPMVHEPGTIASYCSMGTVLIAEIISQASGMSIDQFAKKFLFNPLGIENISWGHTSDKDVIPSGKRLYMTSRDMAKIGQLILNKGKWNGKQIISDNWIAEATAPKTKITGIDYGYSWWSIPLKTNEKIIISKTATGNGGQYIMAIPEINLVAVFTGGAYNSQEDKLAFTIMNRVILPTFDTHK